MAHPNSAYEMPLNHGPTIAVVNLKTAEVMKLWQTCDEDLNQIAPDIVTLVEEANN